MEVKMRFIGKLKRDKRAVGSIIGATFIFLILTSGIFYYVLTTALQRKYAEKASEMEEFDWERSREKIIVYRLTVTEDNKLQITLVNLGSVQVEIIWIGVFDTSTDPPTQRYYNVQVAIPPAANQTITTNAFIDPYKNYEIQIITARGNIIEYNYPIPEPWGSRAYITIDGPNTIDYNQWTTYTIHVTSVTGDPFPYVFVYCYVSGSTAKIKVGWGSSTFSYGLTDSNGERTIQIKSRTQSGEYFMLYVSAGGFLLQKIIYQEPKGG